MNIKVKGTDYIVYSAEGGIALAKFASKKEAVQFMKKEKKRAEEIVAKKRQELIETATTTKAKHRGNSHEKDTRVITVLSEKNPKKAASKSYKRFELYRNGMTVAEFIKAGGHAGDIDWDSKRKFITVQ